MSGAGGALPRCPLCSSFNHESTGVGVFCSDCGAKHGEEPRGVAQAAAAAEVEVVTAAAARAAPARGARGARRGSAMERLSALSALVSPGQATGATAAAAAAGCSGGDSGARSSLAGAGTQEADEWRTTVTFLEKAARSAAAASSSGASAKQSAGAAQTAVLLASIRGDNQDNEIAGGKAAGGKAVGGKAGAGGRASPGGTDGKKKQNSKVSFLQRVASSSSSSSSSSSALPAGDTGVGDGSATAAATAAGSLPLFDGGILGSSVGVEALAAKRSVFAAAMAAVEAATHEQAAEAGSTAAAAESSSGGAARRAAAKPPAKKRSAKSSAASKWPSKSPGAAPAAAAAARAAAQARARAPQAPQAPQAAPQEAPNLTGPSRAQRQAAEEAELDALVAGEHQGSSAVVLSLGVGGAVGEEGGPDPAGPASGPSSLALTSASAPGPGTTAPVLTPPAVSPVEARWEQYVPADPTLCNVRGCDKKKLKTGHGRCGWHLEKEHCSVPGCAAMVVARGVCIAHGARRQKYCTVEGCTRAQVRGGICIHHGAPKQLCTREGCTKYSMRGGLCVGHGAYGPGAASKCVAPNCQEYACHSRYCLVHNKERQLMGLRVAGASVPVPGTLISTEEAQRHETERRLLEAQQAEQARMVQERFEAQKLQLAIQKRELMAKIAAEKALKGELPLSELPNALPSVEEDAQLQQELAALRQSVKAKAAAQAPPATKARRGGRKKKPPQPKKSRIRDIPIPAEWLERQKQEQARLESAEAENAAAAAAAAAAGEAGATDVADAEHPTLKCSLYGCGRPKLVRDKRCKMHYLMNLEYQREEKAAAVREKLEKEEAMFQQMLHDMAHPQPRKCATKGCGAELPQNWSGSKCAEHQAIEMRCSVPGCLYAAVNGGRCVVHDTSSVVRCLHKDCYARAVEEGRCRAHYEEACITCVVEGCFEEPVDRDEEDSEEDELEHEHEHEHEHELEHEHEHELDEQAKGQGEGKVNVKSEGPDGDDSDLGKEDQDPQNEADGKAAAAAAAAAATKEGKKAKKAKPRMRLSDRNWLRGLCERHADKRRCAYPPGCANKVSTRNKKRMCAEHSNEPAVVRRCNEGMCGEVATTKSGTCARHIFRNRPRCQFPNCKRIAKADCLCGIHENHKRCATAGCYGFVNRGAYKCHPHRRVEDCPPLTQAEALAEIITRYADKAAGINPFDGFRPPKKFLRCRAKGCAKITHGQSTFCVLHGAEMVECAEEGCSSEALALDPDGKCKKHSAKNKIRPARKLCTTPGCKSNAKTKGLCLQHGAVRTFCKEDGCRNHAKKKGLCVRHYNRKTKCRVRKCHAPPEPNGLCTEHGSDPKYDRLKNDGSTLIMFDSLGGTEAATADSSGGRDGGGGGGDSLIIFGDQADQAPSAPGPPVPAVISDVFASDDRAVERAALAAMVDEIDAMKAGKKLQQRENRKRQNAATTEAGRPAKKAAMQTKAKQPPKRGRAATMSKPKPKPKPPAPRTTSAHRKSARQLAAASDLAARLAAANESDYSHTYSSDDEEDSSDDEVEQLQQPQPKKAKKTQKKKAPPRATSVAL